MSEFFSIKCQNCGQECFQDGKDGITWMCPACDVVPKQVSSQSHLADILRRIIASADECDAADGPGVPLVSIDARLIAEAREAVAGVED